MADNVVQLFGQEPEASWLCEVSFYRRPDGTIQARLMQMPPELIETTGCEVPERIRIIAGWLAEGAQDMRSQADAFEGAKTDDN